MKTIVTRGDQRRGGRGMNALRHLVTAWGDRDQASDRESLVILALILLIIVASGMSDGPA